MTVASADIFRIYDFYVDESNYSGWEVIISGRCLTATRFAAGTGMLNDCTVRLSEPTTIRQLSSMYRQWQTPPNIIEYKPHTSKGG